MSTRGERLIEAMRVRGMQKQHALAFALGVNESTVTRWKHDGPMSLESAIALCQVLDVSLDWFLVGTGAIDRHPEHLTKTSLNPHHIQKTETPGEIEISDQVHI